MKAGGIVAVDGAGWYAQSGKAKSAAETKPLTLNSLPDVSLSGNLYVATPGALSSIVTLAPTHEPFPRQGINATAIPTGVKPGAYSGPTDATKTSQSGGIKNPAGLKQLRDQPKCDCTVGPLTGDDMTAYFAQIGNSESGGNYSSVNSIGYVGKYQFGYSALIDGGYVKSTCKSNAQLNNPNNWIGKNGIDSLQTWLNSPSEQESAVCAFTNRNYSTMCKIGAVTSEQSAADVAGMLAVAHLLGPGGAKNYRQGNTGGADQYGTTGAQYFQTGQYAVAVLAPQVSQVNQG